VVFLNTVYRTIGLPSLPYAKKVLWYFKSFPHNIEHDVRTDRIATSISRVNTAMIMRDRNWPRKLMLVFY